MKTKQLEKQPVLLNNTSRTNIDRIAYIDIAKAIGIILMVIGHCIPYGSFANKYIYYFHMPLFFILSGICFDFNKYKDASVFLRKKVKQILFPFIVFFVLFLPFCLIFDKGYELKSFTYKAPYTLWFLLVLFLANIIYYGLCTVTYKITNRIIGILCLFAISSILNLTNIDLPYSLSTVCSAAAFLGVGNLYREYFYYIKLSIGLACLIILGVITLILDERYNMQSNNLGGFLYGYIPCFIGSIGIISLSQFIEKFKCSGLTYIGRNSLIIMLFHFPLLILSLLYLKPLIQNHLVYKGLEFFIIIILSLIIGEFIKKRCPSILGK